MESNVFIGHHCPRCHTTIGTYVSVGGSAVCPGCGGPLVAAAGGPHVTVIANAQCKKCGTQIGLLSVIGGKATCPSCGASFT